MLTHRGHLTPTFETLQEFVPAAFTDHPHPDRSQRYSFVSTLELLEYFKELGWEPTSAKQNGKGLYSRHIIHLQNPSSGLFHYKDDTLKSTLILDNSHDGYSPASIHLGIFRLVCSNGMVVGIPGLFDRIRFRHIDVNKGELISLLDETTAQYKVVGDHIGAMQAKGLSPEEREDFAIRAIALREPTRFMGLDGPKGEEILRSLDLNEVLRPMRGEDDETNLWTTFNTLQEKTVKGLYERRAPSGRRSSPREITNLQRSLSFNKGLWRIAEEYLN